MRRREIITLLGGATVWPLAARAQTGSSPVIGFLNATTAADSLHRVSAFRAGLAEAGFIEGYNVAIDYRWAENQLDRLPAMATDLVQRRVAVIVSQNTTMRAVKAATSTLPVVFVSGGDPIVSGLVSSLSHPGGNVTGVSYTTAPLQPKRLALLHELVPPPTPIAELRDPNAPNFVEEGKTIDASARELGRQMLVLSAQKPSEIDAAFAKLVESQAGGLLIGSGAFFINRRRQLATLAIRHAIPAIANTREFVLVGGLMSYGASDTDAYRRAGSHYVGRILKGANPGDLPVEMPTKYELVINLVTAKALGLAVPPTLLATANEVIE